MSHSANDTAVRGVSAHVAASAGVTASLAGFICTTPGRRLPEHIRHATCRAIANWLGCALGAIEDPSLVTVRRVTLGLAGKGHASIVGRRERIDPVNAALVNGLAANALDYDDMHAHTLIHPTGAVVAAALAVAEIRHAPGAALLSAVAAGIEIECRLGLALFPQHYDAGWHISSTLGTLGAAAAVSALLGLDAHRAEYALGIAATQAGGLRAMLPNSCKSFNIGRAAAAGVLAGLLAEAGLDSAADVCETKFGLFDAFGQPADPGIVTRGLGVSYLVSEISIKPYPCGVVIHPLIDACLGLSRERPISARDVHAISIAVHPRAVELAGRRHPETAIGGRFSIYHAAALALARRAAGIAAFDAADVHDPQLAALRDRMHVEADARLGLGQARVRIEYVGGTCAEQAVEFPSGSPELPLTDAQLREKFLELARRAMDDRAAAELFESCLSLERLTDMAELRRHWVS